LYPIIIVYITYRINEFLYNTGLNKITLLDILLDSCRLRYSSVEFARQLELLQKVRIL